MQINEHYKFIDVTKALASFFIVMIHVISTNNPLYFKLTQIGLMATFYFSSGFLFKESYANMDFLSFFKKISKKYLVPYFIGAIIGIFMCFLFPAWYGFLSFTDILMSIFLVGAPNGFGIVWYLLTLFFLYLIFYLFLQIIKPFSNDRKVFFLMLFILAFFYLGKSLYNYYITSFIFIKVPLKLDTCLTAMIYFSLGFLFKFLRFYEFLNNKIFCIIVFITTKILSMYLEYNYLGYTNIIDCRYDNYNIYLIVQLLGIASLITAGSLLENISLLRWLGKENLLIYILHPTVLWIIEEIYGKIIGHTQYYFSSIPEIIFITILTYISTVFLSIYLKKAYKKWSIIWQNKKVKN